MPSSTSRGLTLWDPAEDIDQDRLNQLVQEADNAAADAAQDALDATDARLDTVESGLAAKANTVDVVLTVNGATPDGAGNVTVDAGGGIDTVSGTVTLDGTGEPIREFYTTGSTSFSANGVTTAIAADTAVVWRRDGSDVWTYKVVEDWTATTDPVPDFDPPTVGTLAGSAITDTTFTLTVTGASDAGAGLHATPYRFSTDNGSTWSAWQNSNVYAVTGKTASTAYQCKHQTRDAASTPNVSTLASAVTVTTTAEPPAVSPYTTEVQTDNPAAYIEMMETTLPFVDTEGLLTLTVPTPGWSPQPAAQAIGLHPRSGSFTIKPVSADPPVLDGGDPVSLKGLTAITMEALIRPSALPASGSMFVMAYGYDAIARLNIRVTPTGQLSCQTGGTTFVAATSAAGLIVANTSYHVALTVSGTAVKAYLDGVEVATATTGGFTTGGSDATQHYFRFGAQPKVTGAGGASTLIGHGAGFAIYGTALSAARILAHAQAAGLA